MPEDTVASEPIAHAEAPARRRLYRIPEEGIIAGVCAGLAEYLDLDVLAVRLAFVALIVLTGGGWIIVYVIGWIFMPRNGTGDSNIDGWRERRRARREEWRKEREEWCKDMREHKHGCYSHHCHCRRNHCGGPIGFIIQCLFLWLILWLVYHYIPGTQPFFNNVGDHIQTAWAWLNAKVGH